jgi:hypothetical protein
MSQFAIPNAGPSLTFAMTGAPRRAAAWQPLSIPPETAVS